MILAYHHELFKISFALTEKFKKILKIIFKFISKS